MVILIIVVLWIAVLVWYITATGVSTQTLQEAVAGGACLSSLLIVAVLALSAMKSGKVNRSRKDWSFAPLQDGRLELEDVLAMMRQFLTERGYSFKEDRRTGTRNFSITYFDVTGADFSIRVLWTKIASSEPIIEVGIGPETELNGGKLSQLMGELSTMFAKKYPRQIPNA